MSLGALRSPDVPDSQFAESDRNGEIMPWSYVNDPAGVLKINPSGSRAISMSALPQGKVNTMKPKGDQCTFGVKRMVEFGFRTAVPENLFSNLLWFHWTIVPHDFGFYSLFFAGGNLHPYVMPVFPFEVLLKLQPLTKGGLVVT